MDRADLEQRVDEFAELYSGQAFADAIKTLAADLNGDEEELLKEILLADDLPQLFDDAGEHDTQAKPRPPTGRP